MERLFEKYRLGELELQNRFVFPPIKLGAGNPDGTVTERQLRFYQQIAEKGPALIILEPVSVTPEGKEHPKQLCIHLPESVAEIRKIVDVVHAQGRLACVHLNHAGFPVLCDRQYGGRSRITRGEIRRDPHDALVLMERQALHARRLRFAHPETGALVEVEAPMPGDMARVLDELRAHR